MEQNKQRIVVKVGTSTLTHNSGALDLWSMEHLVRTLADLQGMGHEVILVSSGAIAVGTAKLGLSERPKELRMKQAAAAVGQCRMMHIYDKFFSEYNRSMAQILLTGDDVEDPERAEHLSNTFSALLEMGVIPVVNENDSVSSAEIETGRHKVLGDNDTLSAIVAELPRVELISKMIGKELGDIQSMGKNTALCGDEVLIEADGLSAFGRIQDFDLQIHRGEVVGFAGLLGSGRTETAELLAGVAKPEQGALRMNGREVHFNSPLDAMHHKIAFCPEDRKIQGIIGDLSVRENIIIGLQAKKGMWNHIPLKEQERIADEYIKLLQIKVSSPEQLIRNLSGGNQQKAIIARWLVTQPDLLILDEPTRGIDIGTKTEIQKMVIQLAREQHMSIIFISSEIDEMTRTCTRLAVLRDRRKVAELTGDDINSDRVMAAIAGGA